MEKRVHSKISGCYLITYDDGKKWGTRGFKTEGDAVKAQELYEKMVINMGFKKDEEFTDGHHFIRENW